MPVNRSHFKKRRRLQRMMQNNRRVYGSPEEVEEIKTHFIEPRTMVRKGRERAMIY